MKIELHQIKVQDLFNGFSENFETGEVLGYGGKLNIRPPYQREFVYPDKDRDKVLDSVFRNLPLNVMYWAKTGEDHYEVLDGQQRTISLCRFLNQDFSMEFQGRRIKINTLTKEELDDLKNYELMVYICEGSDREKLDWFQTINIAGKVLEKQELLNAVYTGPWLLDAKRFFSKNGCPAYDISKDLVKAEVIRQELLEKALKWISNNNIEEYMAQNQNKPNANELILYFRNVIAWVETVFPFANPDKDMKSVEWGYLYNKYKDNDYDSHHMLQRVSELRQDEDVTKTSGIYEYLLSGETEEKHLSIRAFTDKQKSHVYEAQGGICNMCEESFTRQEMEADHITPWSQGGRTEIENCQMLCRPCNRKKSDK